MATEDKYLKEAIDREIEIIDYPASMKRIDYEDSRTCENCGYSAGPSDDLECKSSKMKARIGMTTLNVMVSKHKYCMFWRNT